jgi:hypothetical protein
MRSTDSLDEAWHYVSAVHNLLNNTTATAYNHNRNPKEMRVSELQSAGQLARQIPKMSGICDKGLRTKLSPQTPRIA